MTQMTGPIMDIVVPVVSPNQYLKKDNVGNYAFGYSTQNSEMSEVGNAQSKKGHFANIMADGKLRRVDYIADNQGFHILRDTADKSGRYIKREALVILLSVCLKAMMKTWTYFISSLRVVTKFSIVFSSSTNLSPKPGVSMTVNLCPVVLPSQ